MTAAPALLHVDNLSVSFGGLKAVQGLSLKLPSAAVHGLIGPNGAGKTTVFNLLTGIYRASSGSITLGERRIDGLKPHQIAAAGVVRTFQNIRLFGELSVLDNVRLACHLRAKASLGRTIAWTMLASSTSARSPLMWPCRSLTCLKSSMSISASASGVA